MEPARTLEFNGRHFVLHATESRGGARYVIRRFDEGRAFHFLASKLEEREGKAVETPLAEVQGELMQNFADHLYVETIKTHARTKEGGQALSKLFDYAEEHARKKGVNVVSTDALLNVFNFFRLKGFSTADPFAKEKVAAFREKFAQLKKRGVRQEDAKKKALVAAKTPVTILMKKEITRTPP